MRKLGGFVKEEDVRGLPPAKRVKLMAGVSIVPSSQIKRNEGGRGRERFRAKKGTYFLHFFVDMYTLVLSVYPAGGRKSKSSEVSPSTPSLSFTYRYRFAQTTAMYIVDAPDTEAQVAAAPSYIPERTHWSPEEDSFVSQLNQ